jgi:Tol biopolymer transport system component
LESPARPNRSRRALTAGLLLGFAAGLAGCAEVVTPVKAPGEGQAPREVQAPQEIQRPTSAPASRDIRTIEAVGGHSVRAQISADGRVVAFDSYATNLTSGDSRGFINIFVHERQSGLTTTVSTTTGGAPGNDHSVAPALTRDGGLIVFHSDATNLVSGDTNQLTDVFVHDRAAGTTARVNVGPGGAQAVGGPSLLPAISADGRYVAFESSARNLVPGDTNGRRHILVHDRSTGTTTRASVGPGGVQADGDSFFASISADGRYVAFESDATNLVPGDTNNRADVFVHDRATGSTTRVSVATGGAQGAGDSGRPRISADGQYVIFDAEAPNLVPDDTNAFADVFVHDRATGVTTRVSVATGGGQAMGGDSVLPSISADGRIVAFQSEATNLVAEDTNDLRDIFVHDRVTGATSRVSVATGGIQAQGGGAARPQISADGQVVAFESAATNLVPEDTNEVTDVFVHDRGTGITTRVSRLLGTSTVRVRP